MKTTFILEAVDEKMGLVKGREQIVRELSGWLSHEEAIGISYEKLDLILLALEKELIPSEIAKPLKIAEKEVKYVKTLMQNSEHMRKIYVPKGEIGANQGEE